MLLKSIAVLIHFRKYFHVSANILALNIYPMHTFKCPELRFQHYSTNYFSLCFFAQILLHVFIYKSSSNSEAPPSSQPKPPYSVDAPNSVSSDSVLCVSVRVCACDSSRLH